MVERWSFLTSLMLFCAANSAHAQTSTIANALAAQGSVTIAGRSVVASGKLQNGMVDIAVQDGTGGLRVFSRTIQTAIREGDSVVATGTIQRYRGNVELMASALAVIPGALRLIPPRELSADQDVLARHGGELVRVAGRIASSGRSEGGQWLRLHDVSTTARGAVTVWVPANHSGVIDLAGTKAEDSLSVIGIVTSYQDNVNDPVVWQIVPRDASDVLIEGATPTLPLWILWIVVGAAACIGAVLTVARVNARRQLHALQETEQRYTQLLALLPDAVVVHANGDILFTNPAAAELLGYSKDSPLTGRRLAEFIHPDSQGLIGDHTLSGTPRIPRTRAKMVNVGGTVVDVEIAASACVYHDRPAMLLIVRDITAQLRYERDLHALALVDDLTGLQNRRAFTLFAEQELARARRHGRTPVLVFADLDKLKQINDNHGHAAGDTALRLVAQALRTIFRETDIVARWSGDEFVALMVDGSDAAAQHISPRLDAAIASLSPANLPYVVTASVGASPLNPSLPLRDAMERADADLYAQKKRGRRSKIRLTPISVDVMKDPD